MSLHPLHDDKVFVARLKGTLPHRIEGSGDFQALPSEEHKASHKPIMTVVEQMHCIPNSEF